MSPETLREQLRAEISWRGWIRGRYGQRLAVGDDQIKAYQKRLDAQAGKPQYQITEIFIDANRVGGQPQAEQGAAQLIGEIQKGAPIAAVARQFSNSPSAANGGEVGWISTGELPPEVDRVLDGLRPGQLAPPIPVKDGVYIIYLKDKRAGGVDPGGQPQAGGHRPAQDRRRRPGRRRSGQARSAAPPHPWMRHPGRGSVQGPRA